MFGTHLDIWDLWLIIAVCGLSEFINETIQTIMGGAIVRKRDKEIIHLYEKE